MSQMSQADINALKTSATRAPRGVGISTDMKQFIVSGQSEQMSAEELRVYLNDRYGKVVHRSLYSDINSSYEMEEVGHKFAGCTCHPPPSEQKK
jgi:hypothetical protein